MVTCQVRVMIGETHTAGFMRAFTVIIVATRFIVAIMVLQPCLVSKYTLPLLLLQEYVYL